MITNGVRQVYHVAGTGPVMITQSGGPGVEYAYLRSTRLEEHFTMVYPEIPGTGASGPLPEGSTYVDTYVGFLHSLVEHLGQARVHLLGHSHGGFTAQRFALNHPDRVAGLVLYSTSPTNGAEFWATEQAEVDAYLSRHAGNPEIATVAAAITSSVPLQTHAEKTDQLRAYLPINFADFWGRRAEFDRLRETVRAWVVRPGNKRFDYRPELSSIGARTLVITGRHDFICGPVWSEMLHEGIPGSRLTILENSGHFGHLEEPTAFHEAVDWILTEEVLPSRH
ncbi:alpha/beta fold hydrolase [Micromonospora ureilytica]|uniref:Proline iminopeptidase n=1 Tax=Micromonospora ureilytica TaxID=709868 RepID=A0ABS0JC04_9ACTN|nr:alpha/beta hydrolase [Micromonospora ureilytica]MBG6064516.1 proline iminopeptidase [Micromonospora ureilytica]